MIYLLILFISTGLLLVALAVPMILNKVKPNYLYGFRVRQTLEDPAVWYAVNHHSGVRLLWAGVSEIVAAVGLYFVPGIRVDAYAWACLAVFTVVFVIGFIQSWRYMKSRS